MAQCGSRGSRRSGGREARVAARAAALEPALRAVRPGEEGGRYRPLDATVLDRIHRAVLETLEQVGVADANRGCRDALARLGVRPDADGRVRFPPALVEDALARAARDIVLHGQRPEHDLELSAARVYFGTAGAAVSVVDPITREYRDATLADLFDLARLVDALDHVHFFQRPLVARDVAEPRALDFNTCYASVSGTAKHVGSSWVDPEHVRESLEMLHLVAGGEEAWRRRPFVSMSSCFVVPPLRFADDACRCLEAAVHGGMPVLLLSAGQAGATAPAALAGAVVQAMAEVLAGLVYVHALAPGHSAVIGPWPFVSDLRTGAMSGGSGEQAVLMAACAQMGRYYDLPTGVAAGMSDAKLPDAQAGYEKGYTVALAGHAGANLVYESAGMHASLLGCCFESMVIDDDMLGAVNRSVRGVAVDDASLSLDVIRDVCLGGPQHYLGHAQTLELMQREYLYPVVADRKSPKEWREQGSSDAVERARERVRRILAEHHPDHVAPAVDARIRERFDVALPLRR